MSPRSRRAARQRCPFGAEFHSRCPHHPTQGIEEIVETRPSGRRSNHVAISVCGGRHAMGGQQFGTDTWLVDLRAPREHRAFDEVRGLITVDAGAHWPEIIAACHSRHQAGLPGMGHSTKADRRRPVVDWRRSVGKYPWPRAPSAAVRGGHRIVHARRRAWRNPAVQSFGKAGTVPAGDWRLRPFRDRGRCHVAADRPRQSGATSGGV